MVALSYVPQYKDGFEINGSGHYKFKEVTTAWNKFLRLVIFHMFASSCGFIWIAVSLVQSQEYLVRCQGQIFTSSYDKAHYTLRSEEEVTRYVRDYSVNMMPHVPICWVYMVLSWHLPSFGAFTLV